MKVKALLEIVGDGIPVNIESQEGETFIVSTPGELLESCDASILLRKVHVMIPELNPAFGERNGVTIIVEE